MSKVRRLRCAIYTRKSSEEGLEQDFNSLDAQREACEAYVASQAGLGWKVVSDRFDDGGISGATMERPALQRMLSEIQAGRIDVVVVYKIDRLTRSLADFARIIEVFDERSVSFVSVTQSFNTTSSMGRLTLNVLLSFAQFEREVTAERIRDKIAASKKKGMWMGGMVPLGYDSVNKKLVVNQDEAVTVRKLFDLYREEKSIRAVQDRAQVLGLKTKHRVAARNGRSSGRSDFSCGHLRTILSNPLYVGRIRHRGQTFDGQHEAIIDDAIFAEVQDLLKDGARHSTTLSSQDDMHLLTGILFDETGKRLSPSHATKSGRRYRYYISGELMRGRKIKSGTDWRIPTSRLDPIVVDAILAFLRSRSGLLDTVDDTTLSPDHVEKIFKNADETADGLRSPSPAIRRQTIQVLLRRVTLGSDRLQIEIMTDALLAGTMQSSSDAAEDRQQPPVHCIELPIVLRCRGVERRIVVEPDAGSPSANPDPVLIEHIAKAHRYLRRLTCGDSISASELAAKENTDVSDLSRILRLAFLAPDITAAILDGKQPVELTATRLMRLGEIPYRWDDQRKALGFRSSTKI
jgi:site-specific DNA recombinase